MPRVQAENTAIYLNVSVHVVCMETSNEFIIFLMIHVLQNYFLCTIYVFLVREIYMYIVSVHFSMLDMTT